MPQLIGTSTLLTLVFLCTGVIAVPPEKSAPVKSFRSELWQLEYREQDRDGTGAKRQAAPGAQQASGSLGISLPRQGIPGQTQLNDLTQETPVADWQVDASADTPDSDGYRDEPTAWQLSRAQIAGDEVNPELSEGPTITTYLVGIVACIVMTGAMLSGRE